MYNVNEIVSRMNKGESLDNIAAELTAALNEAKIAYEAEQAMKVQAQMEVAKREDMADILEDLISWVKTYYADLAATFTKDLSDEDKDDLFETLLTAIIESMDQTVETFNNPRSLDPFTMLMMDAFMGDLNHNKSKSKKTTVKTNNTSLKTEDDILKDFLNKICH